MSDQAKQMNLNIDLKNTTVVETKEGNVVFQQGVILRRVSKFVVGADEDAVMPIPVFYDPISGKLLKDTVPAELRKDYEDHMIDG
jgi:hypothetical protein|tara:strand:+ start:9746 stop:10000 length:255 start_codon:yes stop_codon:yes gene_type:complete